MTPTALGADWVVADAGRGALYVARRDEAAHPSRVLRRRVRRRGGGRVLTSDGLDLAGVVVVDPARALARAVPLALSRPALDREGLTALYVD